MAYPILAAQNTWWKPNVSTVTRASITEIEIMDSYTPDSSVTVVDSWDASAAQDGSITCYVIGTKLIMAGNGSGKIAANADSSNCFGGYSSDRRFTKMASFVGSDLIDTSSVTVMFSMFCYCSALATIDLSTWDVSNVKDMCQMFALSRGFTSIIGLENWDVSSVTDFSMLFSGCSNLVSINSLSNWNVSNATLLSAMFYNTPSLTSIGDISNWNTANVTDMSMMFANCQTLPILDLSKWDVSRVTNMSAMFDSCKSITSLGNLSGWNVGNVTNAYSLFSRCDQLVEIGDISNWNVSSVTDMSQMFRESPKLTNIGNLSNWNPSSCTNMTFMFWGASSIGEIDVSNWDVSKVTTLDHFAAHAGLRRKGIENWNTSSLINANAAFHNCAEEELDLSGWDVSNVQFFCQMFENSPNLKRIKGLENWDTSAGLGFDGMFERCYVLEELDLSAFNTTKAKNGVTGSTNGHKTATLQNMFLSCNNLKKVTVGPNFSINGDGTNTAAANKAILPTPSTDYIEGADGNWYTFNGDAYAPNAMKDKTAETYYASYDIVADMDVICKNGSLIDTAKAIREIAKNETKYVPAEFGNAVRNIGVSIEVDEEGNAVLVNATLTVDENSDGTLGV